MSGKAVEASGDINTLLLDKTGTVTLGNRQAVEFIPFPGVTAEELADAAQLSSLADETPEGRSIVVLAKEKYGLRGREVAAHEAHFIPFSAYTRMSGVDIDGRMLRKGASSSIANFVKELGGTLPGIFDRNPTASRAWEAHLSPSPIASAHWALSISKTLSKAA